MYNGWTESPDSIEARKQRILAGCKPTRKSAWRQLVADLKKYRPEILRVAKISLLVNIVMGFLIGWLL